MFKRFALLAIVAALIAPAAAAPRLIEVRQRAEFNPSIYFSGVAGNPQLSAELKSFLSICGWFDMTENPSRANYTLNIQSAGNAFNVYLLQGTTPFASWRFSGSSARELAKSITDAVIERTFEQLKVRSFCRSRIAFAAETARGIRNIFVCDIDGKNVEQITNYRTLNVEPGWSPDGNTIFFSKYHHSGIDIIETTASTPRRSRLISASRGLNNGAAVSPNGSEIAVILSPDRQVDLYVLGLRQRSRRRLTRGIAVEASPSWSPDGNSIAFVSDRHGSPRIFICDRFGNNLRRLPTIGSDAVTPAWSKDNKIAYATRIGGQYAIAVYDLKTRSNTRVSKSSGNWESPEWAADNRQVVCKRTVGGKSALYVLDTRTGNSRLLISTNSPLFDPAWSPCRSK